MTTPLKVLVTGATGNQGGAVAQALMARGHIVRALTRNTESAAAIRLAAKGAEIMAGDFEDAEGLAKALQGVDTFYLMGSPMEVGVDGETKQGIALANAAKTAMVGHLVYGSVANADLNTQIPHFDSKYKVEQYIKTLAIPYTISAPVFFMDNVIAPWSIDALKTGKIMQAMPADRLLQQVSVKNIGEFVASLISRRESVFGERFDIAGDELSGNDMARILTETIKHSIQYESFPVSVLKEQSEDMAAMFKWFDNVGYNIDLKKLHNEFPDINWQKYNQWVDAQDWNFLDNKATKSDNIVT